MSRRWKRAATALFVAGALIFAGLLLRDQWDRLAGLRAAVGGLRWRREPAFLAAALAAAVVNLFWMATAWVALYRDTGGTLGYARGVRVWLVTNLGRYIPGKIWHITGLTAHLKERGGTGAGALSSIFTFQVIVLLTGLATGVAFLGGDLARLPGGSPGRLVLLGVLLLALLHPAVVRLALRLAARILREEAGEVRPPSFGRIAGGGVIMLVAWLLYGLSLRWFVAASSGSPAGGYLALTGIYAVSYVAGYLVLLAPGGLVVREGALAVLLTALTPLSAAMSAAVAVGFRVLVTLSELLGMGLSFLLPGERVRSGSAGSAPAAGPRADGGETSSGRRGEPGEDPVGAPDDAEGRGST